MTSTLHEIMEQTLRFGEGLLRNYLYDSYAAHFEQKTRTGKAARGGEEGATFKPRLYLQ